MKIKKNIIILGGGQAGAYAAKEILSLKPKSDVTIISSEKHLPYERPPLSKDYLLGKMNLEQCLFFSNDFYIKNNINIICNETIIKVDFEKKVISSDINEYHYDKLLITTGSRNRILDFKYLDKHISSEILYLRNIEESQEIRDKIKVANSIAIIGGGFIGLEIASSASQLGKKVTIIELGKQLMGRVIPNEIASLVQIFHEKKGNKFYLENQIKEISKENNLFKINLSSNITINVDLIIVGAGSIPSTTIFSQTSLEIDNGIVTDEYSKTSVQDVFAAGDVSNFYHPFYGMYMRLESYKHAQNHGINAAKNILNIKTSYKEIPWMWSDQFTLNIQMTGICNDYEAVVKRGNNIEDGIIFFFLKNRRIHGACGLGIGGKIGRDVRLAGKLSEKKIKITKEILSDKNIKLNKLLK